VRAISVKQPWAGLIASGRKTIETRTWATSHRGDILIVSCAKPEGADSGIALCVARIVDCRPMTRDDERAACVGLYPGAWAWILENVRPIRRFPVKGRMGLYDVEFRPQGTPPPKRDRS
jgi:hypothetical protein